MAGKECYNNNLEPGKTTSFVVIDKKGNEIVIPAGFSFHHKVPVTYAKRWFDLAETTKPKIIYDVPTGNTLEHYRHYFGESADIPAEITVERAVAYLCLLASHVKARLDSDWKSYGVEIGKSGQEVSVASLVELCPRTIGTALNDAARSTKVELDAYICVNLLSSFKVKFDGIKEYNKAMNRRLDLLLQTLKSGNFYRLAGTYYWNSDKNLAKIGAAYDMFFHRFPLHAMAKVRFSTMPLRYKDCGALEDMNYFGELIGGGYEELRGWTWSKELDKQFEQMNFEVEEIKNPHSYLPYASAMDIVQKSAYSVSENKEIHYLVHAVGCGRGEVRSMNRKYISATKFDPLISIAACILARTTEGDGRPTTGDGTIWYRYIYRLRMEVPEDILRSAYEAWARMDGLRAGTIGQHLKNYAVLKLKKKP